jgi:hypothetical protein
MEPHMKDNGRRVSECGKGRLQMADGTLKIGIFKNNILV